MSRSPTRSGSCFLCGNTSGDIVVRENGFAGRVCACGIVYIDPRPLDTEDSALEFHPEEYYRFPARTRARWVRSLGTGNRLVEIGCGRGHFLEAARRLGFDVHGIEPDPRCVEHLRGLDIPVEPALVERSAQPDASFDVAFHVDLLSHFEEPVESLSAISRLVKPDGVVCFEVGVFGGLDQGWYRWIGRPGYPQHLWFYSEPALLEVIRRAGLRVVSQRRFGLSASALVSTLGRRLLGRTQAPARLGGEASRAGKAYARLQSALRYELGAFLPAIGPSALFVACRRTAE
jgi:SAM-dependent methyltransferase